MLKEVSTMATIKSTKLLSRGKVSMKRTPQGLVVTSTGSGKNFGIYYVFNVKENTSYVATLTGKKLTNNANTILAIWTNSSSLFSCKRVFTTTSNTFGHMIPHRAGKQMCIGVLFQKAVPGASFLLSNLSLMSRDRRKTVKFNTLKAKKKSKPAPAPKPAPKPAPTPVRRQTVPDIKNPPKKPKSSTLKAPIDLEKIRQIASQKRSPSISSESPLQGEESSAITNLTEQMEKLSKLKTDMEQNFSKMFEEQRMRIKRLEQEKKKMKIQLSRSGTPKSIPVHHVKGERESDSEEFYGSMSASMDMFPSIEIGDSIDSVPALEYPIEPLGSPEMSSPTNSDK